MTTNIMIDFNFDYFYFLIKLREFLSKSKGFASPGLGIELATPTTTHLSSKSFFLSIFVYSATLL